MTRLVLSQLDGNVHRLFSRFLVLHAPPKSKATQDILWAAATAMVEHEYDDADHPGDINQALIELGSTICRLRDPCCGDCPLNPWCGAYNKAIRVKHTPPSLHTPPVNFSMTASVITWHRRSLWIVWAVDRRKRCHGLSDESQKEKSKSWVRRC